MTESFEKALVWNLKIDFIECSFIPHLLYHLSDYPFGIFQTFLNKKITKQIFEINFIFFVNN